MSFRELTVLQEKLRNAADTSAIIHTVETNGWRQLDHSWRWIVTGNGSPPERDCGRRWMTTWITVRDRLRPDMDRDRIWMDDRRWNTGGGWQEMDQGRWIKGDGSRETDDNQSRFLYEATKLQSSADLQTYGVPAAWLHQPWYRALFRALFRDTEICSYKPKFQCRIRSRIRSRVTQV